MAFPGQNENRQDAFGRQSVPQLNQCHDRVRDAATSAIDCVDWRNEVLVRATYAQFGQNAIDGVWMLYRAVVVGSSNLLKVEADLSAVAKPVSVRGKVYSSGHIFAIHLALQLLQRAWDSVAWKSHESKARNLWLQLLPDHGHTRAAVSEEALSEITQRLSQCPERLRGAILTELDLRLVDTEALRVRILKEAALLDRSLRSGQPKGRGGRNKSPAAEIRDIIQLRRKHKCPFSEIASRLKVKYPNSKSKWTAGAVKIRFLRAMKIQKAASAKKQN